MSLTAPLTASTFELFPEDPFERDLPLRALEALAPLLELRDLVLVAFDFELAGLDLAFEVLVLAFEAFDFDDDFARFGADSFRDLGFDLDFVWAIVSSPRAVP
jgi:hypothetical protein